MNDLLRCTCGVVVTTLAFQAVQSLVGPLLKVLQEKNTDVKDTDSKVAESL
jgi:hypothetical protein